jgi:hypothetical protein
MAEEKKEIDPKECGARRCGGCKFLAGVLVGLLIAGTSIGIFLAGRLGRHHSCGMGMHGYCPMMQQAQPSK